MISIIISSANKQQLGDVISNIKATVGIPYEIIAVDNGNGDKGICEVYNHGIAVAKYDVMCFMHEDVKIHTENWGGIVLDLFIKNEKVGLIGIAGSKHKAFVPSHWFSFLAQLNRVNIIQQYKFRSAEKEVVCQNPESESVSLVTGVDGVWFCTHKKVTQQIKFDQQLLKGFHGYDVDFSLSVGLKWDVVVTYDVLLEHFSEGNYNKQWIESTLVIHKKWRHTLPRTTVSLTPKENVEGEKKAFLFFIEKMKEAGYSNAEILTNMFQSKIYARYGWLRFFRLAKHIYRKK
jgi:glycosyltransferase involved in cell wall biosynthesis